MTRRELIPWLAALGTMAERLNEWFDRRRKEDILGGTVEWLQRMYMECLKECK